MHIFRRIFIFIFMFLVIVPLECFAFKISDLSSYQNVSVKTFVKRDSPKSGAKTIQATKELETILGREKKDYETEYVYFGSDKFEESGTSRYYYFYPPSYKGRGKGELKYDKNEIMYAGTPGDILVIAKKSENEILLLIIQQHSRYIDELYSILGMQAPADEPKRTLWQRLWGIKGNTQANYEIDAPSVPIVSIPENSWARIYFTPGPDCENNIIAQIDDAIRAIDVAVYSITNDKIVDSLIEAHNRGVTVRVISDRLQAAGKSSLIGRIEDAGIPVVLNRRHKIMHNKFAIFDKKDIETGSYNWTDSATKSNAENCMFFPEQNKEFTNQFKYLWRFYQS